MVFICDVFWFRLLLLPTYGPISPALEGAI